MVRYTESKFAVYFNKINRHVTIHKIDCTHIEKHGGEHEKEQGGYGYFVTDYEAKVFADSLSDSVGLPDPKNCKFCYKED